MREDDIKSIYSERDRFINKFPNGEELYRKSALFSHCANLITRGYDPEQLIYELINMNEKTIKAFEEFLNRSHGFPITWLPR